MDGRSAEPHQFTCRTARSSGILTLFIMLVIAETGILHLLLVRHVPVVAYAISSLSLTAIVWLVADYRAFGREALRLDRTHLHVRIGLRVRAVIPRDQIATAFAPAWRDLRTGAPPYLNPTKPATPNALLIFRGPQDVLIVGRLHRAVARLALHLDEPGAFFDALDPNNALENPAIGQRR